MASIQSLDFTTLVQNMVTSVQARASIVLNLTIGSVLRAIIEAVASVCLWLEGLAAYVLTLTRAATSIGPDLDTFVNDFGLTRLPAVAAVGQLTFARFSTIGQAVVPVNQAVQSEDGTQNFFVTLDTTNPNYNAGVNGYILAPSTASIIVPAQAVTPGAAGNVLANTVSVITQPISGVDTVTNANPFTNGINAESDSALRTRFVAYLNSLYKATLAAIQFAIMSIQQGIQFTIKENYAYSGAYQPGFFYVVIDDGTGTPPTSLINAVAANIENYRALAIQYAVYSPTVETVTVGMTITSAPGYTHLTVAANVSNALKAFIQNLGLGNSLPYTQLAAIAYAVAGVQNVNSYTLNSGTSDVAATNQQTIKPGTITVS